MSATQQPPANAIPGIPEASFASPARPKPWEAVKEAILGPCRNPQCWCHTGPHTDDD